MNKNLSQTLGKFINIIYTKFVNKFEGENVNYKLTIAYNGKNYCGYQIQPNLKTVQGQLEEALKGIFKTEIKTVASGRTDAMVSAIGQVVSFCSDSKISEYSLLSRLNIVLPPDIRVQKVSYVNSDFNARFSAKKKTYVYNFYISKISNPYLDDFCYRVGYNLDLEKLKTELKSIEGTFDFSAFSSSDTQTQSMVRTIYSTSITAFGNIFSVSICGNGFLKNMIRIIMGTLFDIARGKIKCGMLEIINSKSRAKAGKTAGAVGLVLTEVNYD